MTRSALAFAFLAAATAGFADDPKPTKSNPFVDPKAGDSPKSDETPKKRNPFAGFFKRKRAEEPKDPKETKLASDGKEPTAEQVAFFEKKIRPVLVSKCYSCHQDDGKKTPKGGLVLDTREGTRAGGESGPAVVPGNVRKSLLVQAMKGAGNSKQMPPKEKLSAEVIADFEKWIEMGAPDPRGGKAVVKKPEWDIEKGKQHWSFQPVKKVDPPAVKQADWPSSKVDKFLLATMESKGLTPAADADKRTLLRRVYFDLVGLPPTPEEVEEFLRDRTENAFEKVVDKLLASKAFGERWGRHWLDVARYAESTGKEVNMLYPFAWRYRDYVIKSFNDDKPIDQFFREQLAGDLLPAGNDTQKAEQLVATGYLAIGAKSLNENNRQQFALDVADEQIDAFSQGMLGLTVACARCHDHKFDPVPTADYYALAGIFLSTETRFGGAQVIQARQTSPLIELPKEADLPVGPTLSKREQASLKERLDGLKKQQETAMQEARKDPTGGFIRVLFIRSQVSIIERQLGYYDENGNPKKMAMGAADRTFARDSKIHIRGERDKLGDTVPRGFVQVISTSESPRIRSGSGRKQLADWVAAKENPLTARVYVNRVWGHLFGQGLVATPDNFGTTGRKPTHPELLDHLANWFTESNWSTKSLIKGLVMTRAYRMSSQYSEANAAIDPDNEYLWRMSKRRLDAEAIRDAMLAVSGTLDKTAPNGSPLQRFEGPVQAMQRYGQGMGNYTDTAHRSIYIPIIRDQVPEVLELFDFAEPSLVSGSRDDTSVPSQALFLLNNPQVMKLAEATGERLQKNYTSITERIDAGFRLAYGRPPTQREADAADRFINRFSQAETKAGLKSKDVQKATWAAFAQALFAAAEFRYVD